MAYPRFRLSRQHKMAVRTAGDVVLGAAFADIDTTLDLTLRASVGDTIEAAAAGVWNNENDYGFLNFWTLVGGAVVNNFGGAGVTDGWPSWLADPGRYTGIGGSALYVLQSGDLSAGKVTLRLRGKHGGSGKTLQAHAAAPLVVWAKNLGPPAS